MARHMREARNLWWAHGGSGRNPLCLIASTHGPGRAFRVEHGWHSHCIQPFMERQWKEKLPAPVRATASAFQGVACIVLLVLSAMPARSQIVFDSTRTSVTVEAYGNLTTGAARESARSAGQAPDAVRLDGAARVFGRLHTSRGPDVGVRVVAEGYNDHVHLGEASILLFGSAGRLEVGKRMGLPDVLTGYAPNSFTYTTAEFGPPTGRTLDPGGGLQTQFLRPAMRMRVESLTAYGVTASQFGDQSTKILYVSPKHDGWLAGASFARDADDSRYDWLEQIGVVHESYWQQNVWRWGGLYAHARAAPNGAVPLNGLNSLSLGTSVTLNDSLDLGIAGSYDGRSGLPRAAQGTSASPAWGTTASVNYNSGSWTVGAYYQYARASSIALHGADRLSAFEVGASYRFTTKLRVYGAWYLYNIENEALTPDPLSGSGDVFTLGLRATL